ncbi:MAG: hypothetical protein JW874_00670, partial [Spirochaetales bacterium]|nr:hypothetical protein [Spirochaetales bacterium]
VLQKPPLLMLFLRQSRSLTTALGGGFRFSEKYPELRTPSIPVAAISIGSKQGIYLLLSKLTV